MHTVFVSHLGKLKFLKLNRFYRVRQLFEWGSAIRLYLPEPSHVGDGKLQPILREGEQNALCFMFVDYLEPH